MINFAYIGCMDSSIDKSVSIFDNVRTSRHSNIQFLFCYLSIISLFKRFNGRIDKFLKASWAS